MLPMTNKQISNKIWKRVYTARRKHPVFAASTDQAWSVIHAEIMELALALADESWERQVDEALDVIATCIRFIAQEHEK